jgi:hypothetical protein
MFGLPLSKSGGKIVAVVDIGSASAAVGIMRIASRGPAVILAAARSNLPTEDRTAAHSATAIGGAIGEAAQKALAAYTATPRGKRDPVRELYAVLRAPWTKSSTARAGDHFPSETKITDPMIASLAKRALDTQKEIDTSAILEANVIHIELNGYPTRHAAEQRATLIDVTILASQADPNMRTAALTALHQAFPALEPKLRSHTRALLALLSSDAPHVKNCMVIDMASEGTSIAVVRKGVITGQVLANEGVRSIIGTISGTTSIEALSMMRMIESERCESDACKTLLAKIAAIEPELVRVFGEHFGKLAATRPLPNDMLLLAHPDLLWWLARFFARIDFSQFTITSQPFVVHQLSAQDSASAVISAPGTTPDASLSLAAALVHIEG